MVHKHEFSQGDRVTLRSAPRGVRRDGYKIVRQLPENAGGELQYRIRAEGEAVDHMVSEIDLIAVRTSGVFSA